MNVGKELLTGPHKCSVCEATSKPLSCWLSPGNCGWDLPPEPEKSSEHPESVTGKPKGPSLTERSRAKRPFKVEYEGMYRQRATRHATRDSAEAAIATFLESDEARDPVAHLYDPEHGWKEFRRA
jgi:hypothetical protein